MVETTAGIAQRLCVHAESLQSCRTLCNPVDCSLPGAMQTSKLETHWEDPMGAVSMFPHADPGRELYTPDLGFGATGFAHPVPRPIAPCSWRCAQSPENSNQTPSGKDHLLTPAFDFKVGS